MDAKSDTNARQDDISQVVVFTVGSKEYAVDILAVREVIRPATLTHAPGLPDYVDGLMALGEETIPVTSLRRVLGEASGPDDQYGRIIIAGVGDKAVGLAVDSVREVLRLGGQTPYMMEPPSEATSGRYMRGVVRTEDHRLHLLDLDRLVDEVLTGMIPTRA